MIRSALLLLASSLLPVSMPAQEPQVVPGARIASMTSAPLQPRFGDVFEVQVTLRVAPGWVASVSDSLIATTDAESFSPGLWRTRPAAGDSLDAVGTFPVIGYVEGRLDLPSVEVWTVERGGAARVTRTADEPGVSEPGERHVVPLGAVTVSRLLEMEDSGAVMIPRPPADVAGGEWSVWLLLAVGLLSAVGFGGGGRLLSRWWAAAGGALTGRRRRSPRVGALAELDRIRSLGWHRNGRVDEFYASSTDAIRRFAHELDPTLSTALTSTELLQKLEERWGDGRVTAIASTIRTAERTKFGAERPGGDEAEADWSALREWVRSAPES